MLCRCFRARSNDMPLFIARAREDKMSAIKIPKKVHERIISGLRKYQPIVRRIAERDVSEADTVTVIKDMLSDIFGYDKYAELTSEQQIRGTYCDLAIRVEGKIYYLCEVKSAGTNLTDSHLRQAVNYGSHQGIEWIILSNARRWIVYRIKFSQPISWEEVCNIELDTLPRTLESVEKLFLLCRESIASDALESFHRHAQIVNRNVIAEVLQGEAVVATLRKEYRRLFDGLKVNDDDLRGLLVNEVIKRDALDGEAAVTAKAMVKKAEQSLKRKAAKTK